MFGKPWDVQFTTIRMNNYETSTLLHPKFRFARLIAYFQESYNVKYLKVINRLKTLRKAEAYLEPKQASMMELFCEYT